jgi:hypothetical protein
MRLLIISLVVSLNGCGLLMQMNMQSTPKEDIHCRGVVERVSLVYAETGARIPAAILIPDHDCVRARRQIAIDGVLLMVDTKENPSAGSLLSMAGRRVFVDGRVRKWHTPRTDYESSGIFPDAASPATRPVDLRLEVKSISPADP